MPVYVAECLSCKHEFEYVQIVARHAESPECERCKGETQQILTPVRGFVDLPAYISPASGKVIRGRAARREDFKRTDCRPYEGYEQERKEVERRNKEREDRFDKRLTDELSHSYEAMSPESRAALEHLTIETSTLRG